MTTSRLDSGSTTSHTSSATPGATPPAQLMLWRLLQFLAQCLQRAQPRGWCFPRLLPLSTEDAWDQFPGGYVKDRLGDQREGSEWEPIKILLEGD
jgi:hypothetical protein